MKIKAYMMKVLLISSIVVLFIQSEILPAQNITLEMGKNYNDSLANGESDYYQINLETGEYAHIIVNQIDIDVTIKVVYPDSKTVKKIDSPNGSSGPENIIIETEHHGNYTFEILPTRKKGKGNYTIQIHELLSADEYQKRLALEKVKRHATINWLKSNVIKLKGVEAEQGFEDMQPLKKIIGDARIVALGEATHGTREFFQLKHRMLEFLVTEMGFTLFGIEAALPEAFDINDYVLSGKGDPENALCGLQIWPWNTQEVLDMIRWMRYYNSNPEHIKKVKFFGFDMQYPVRAIKVLLAYLEKYDQDSAKIIKNNAALKLLINPYTYTDFSRISEEEKGEALNIIESIQNGIESKKDSYIAQNGQDNWKRAQLCGQVLYQNILRSLKTKDRMLRLKRRDGAMAKNIRTILENEGHKAKMVIWAHNGHIANQEYRLGYFLRELFGNDLVAFAFAFNQGSFQALELPYKGVKPFHVEPLEDQSLDATLSETGFAVAAIDFRTLPDTGYVAEWFNKKHKTRIIGYGFKKSIGNKFVLEEITPQLYDALLFVNETTSARPNPGARLFTPKRVLHSPLNLDFEEGEPGSLPEWWVADKYRLNNLGYQIELSNKNPYHGKQCLKINRNIGKDYGESYATVSQRIVADPYLGKRIKLSAAVRAELVGENNQAYLWFHAGKKHKLSITAKNWEIVELSSEIPARIIGIEYGVDFVGEGTAWLDFVSVEILSEHNEDP